MLVSEIQTQVKNIFGDTAQAQINDAMILDWINNGQKDICRKAECLEQLLVQNTIANQEVYDYPGDFIKERRVTVDGIKLTRLTMTSIDMLFPDRASTPVKGNALYYFHWDRALRLYPIPSITGTTNFILWYVKYAAALTAPGNTPEIPDVFHEDLVRYCLWKSFEQDQDWAAAGQFKQDYDTRLLNTIYDSNVLQSEAYPSVQLCAGDN